MTALLDALADVARSVQELGEVETFDYTPSSVVAPAFFPGGVESVTRQDQYEGQRVATVSWWLVVLPGEAEAQRRLYELADRIWDQLEHEVTGPDRVARVVAVNQVGSVTVAGSEFWGCAVVLELFV